MEKGTRSLWALAADGSGQETRWFYERARGQYTDALRRSHNATVAADVNTNSIIVIAPPSVQQMYADLIKRLDDAVRRFKSNARSLP